MNNVLYEFDLQEPLIWAIVVGVIFLLATIFVAIMALVDEKNATPGIPMLIGFLMIITFSLFAAGIINKGHYAIMKIETFTDYENISKKENVVTLLKDNVFLVKVSSTERNK